MIEEQQSLEEALFELAQQKSSPGERTAFLDSVCRDNAGLRARLEALLEAREVAPLQRSGELDPGLGTPA